MHRTDDEIRQEVARSYGNRVRHLIGDVEVVPLAHTDACCTPSSSSSSCCGAEAGDAGCCGEVGDDGEQISRIAALYAEAEVADLPATVTDVAFGCGNPTAIAALGEG